MCKTLLLVGDFSSIHMYNYVKNVISKADLHCTGYHFVDDEIKSEFSNFYASVGINVVQGISPTIYKTKGTIAFTKQSINKIKALGSFDFMHLQAVRLFVCPALFLSRRQFKKIILTYWGSDLYRSSKSQMIRTVPLLHASDVITMMTEDMRTFFQSCPWYINRYSKKVSVMDLGNMFYEDIKHYVAQKNELKKEFGLSENKIVCSIGYLGRRQMRQFETINAILDICIKYRQSLQLAIPAYGIADEDYERIKNLLEVTGITFKIYREFMDGDRVSKYRAICDIFIHAQTTDALSCAMLEHLFAGSIVINGSWLNYSSLDDISIHYIKFNSFKDLPSVLEGVINNFYNEYGLCLSNQAKVSSISSWDVLRDKWLNLYN